MFVAFVVTSTFMFGSSSSELFYNTRSANLLIMIVKICAFHVYVGFMQLFHELCLPFILTVIKSRKKR